MGSSGFCLFLNEIGSILGPPYSCSCEIQHVPCQVGSHVATDPVSAGHGSTRADHTPFCLQSTSLVSLNIGS